MMCVNFLKLFVFLIFVETIFSSNCTEPKKKLSKSTPKRRRIILSDVNAYLTAELNEEEQLFDPWSFFRNYELGQYVEGDMLIPKEYGNRRTFLKKARFWPEGIVPFYVNDLIRNNTHALAVLLNSMRTITSATSNCVQFYPVEMKEINQYPQLPFLNVTGHQKGCFSDVGQSTISNVQSQINLNLEQCFLLPGNSLHELLHVLGQTHEHMRPDRDHHIKIIWENIAPNAQSNFEILEYSEVESYDLPYDYDSITHYARTAFTIDPAVATIIPLNKTATIGQRTHLSEIDKMKLRKAYTCDKDRKRYSFLDILQIYNLTETNNPNIGPNIQKPPTSIPLIPDILLPNQPTSNTLIQNPLLPNIHKFTDSFTNIPPYKNGENFKLKFQIFQQKVDQPDLFNSILGQFPNYNIYTTNIPSNDQNVDIMNVQNLLYPKSSPNRGNMDILSIFYPNLYQNEGNMNNINRFYSKPIQTAYRYSIQKLPIENTLSNINNNYGNRENQNIESIVYPKLFRNSINYDQQDPLINNQYNNIHSNYDNDPNTMSLNDNLYSPLRYEKSEVTVKYIKPTIKTLYDDVSASNPQKFISKFYPSILQSNPSILQSNPSILQSKPTTLQSNPSIPQYNPSILQSYPYSYKSPLRQSDDFISNLMNFKSDPSNLQSNPTIYQYNPSNLETNPSGLESNPSSLESNPSISIPTGSYIRPLLNLRNLNYIPSKYLQNYLYNLINPRTPSYINPKSWKSQGKANLMDSPSFVPSFKI